MAEAITPSNSRPPTNFRQQAVRARQNQDIRRAQQQAPADANAPARERAARDAGAADDRSADVAAARRTQARRANDRPRETQPPPGQVLDTFA